MKNLVIIYTLSLVISLLITSCKQNEINYCNFEKKDARIQVQKGNIYYIPKKNHNPLSEYYIYRKYNLTSYLLHHPMVLDSCFKLVLDSVYTARKLDTKKIESELDSLDLLYEKKDSKGIKNIPYFRMYNDGYVFAVYNRGQYTYPKMIESEPALFKKNLLKEILKRDSSFNHCWIWIDIDSIGNVSNIEIKLRYSEEIDSLIIKKYYETKWIPFSANGKNYNYRFSIPIVNKDE